jgi:ATP-binding cassette subfamily C (CFTR/MRP) protein 10
MVKGYQKQIHMIDHLSQLPIDLDVSQVCDSFMKKYNSNTEQHQNNPIINPEILLNQHTYEDLSTDTTPSVTITSTKNLGSALMRSFGRKFMILGVFKLLNDIISFSGPLLLNQLVQFVETKNAKLKDGCMFAAALLLSTLVGSIINIHFSNALNKLCLRIRTALITLIYRKAVLVRLDELNRLSTGQIVNYMSIDTDSVVNAFPSFHSFWSLPFQIAVTLYLLYSQIGISFVIFIFNYFGVSF